MDSRPVADQSATNSFLVFLLSLIPLPMTRLALVACLTNTRWQKWCSGISKARSQEALWLPPGSPERLSEGALTPHGALATSIPCCAGKRHAGASGENQAEASLLAIPAKTREKSHLDPPTSSSTSRIAARDLCQHNTELKACPCGLCWLPGLRSHKMR